MICAYFSFSDPSPPLRLYVYITALHVQSHMTACLVFYLSSMTFTSKITSIDAENTSVLCNNCETENQIPPDKFPYFNLELGYE